MNIRQEKICELVKEKNFMSIMELSKQLHYSESTVRRDLTVLENLKMIKRISGGAMYVKEEHTEDPTEIKSRINSQQKSIIADLAIDFIADHSTIFLDSSSTSQYIAKRLKDKKNLTIFTTNLSTADILDKQQNNHNIYFVGGKLSNGKVGGSCTEFLLRNVFFDQAFLSCGGISDEGYVSELLEEEAMLKKIIRQQTRELFLVADEKKFGKSFTFTSFSLRDLDILITDTVSNEAIKQLITKNNLNYYYNE